MYWHAIATIHTVARHTEPPHGMHACMHALCARCSSHIMWLHACICNLPANHTHTCVPMRVCAHVQEKRKREMGQASRGGSYVEEQKRMGRALGMYSGFD